MFLARECPVELSNEVALALPHHDSSLGLDVRDLILSHHVSFAKSLNGKVFAGELLLGQINTPKRSSTDGLDDLEVFD